MPVCLAILIGLTLQPSLDERPAEDTSNASPSDKERVALALKLTKDVAQQYEFVAGGDASSKLELRAEPILRWSNPVIGSIHGNVFLWTRHGRPKMVASIFKWFSPLTHMSHEFHSLSGGPIEAERSGEKVWSAADPGIEFSRLPDAPLPAATSAQRLRQMRTFARRFTAIKTDRDDITRELRLMAQPVYRYQSSKESVVDGAMFAFVEGTDPETWLLIEAHRTETGDYWMYALARMNSTQFAVKYLDREVWRVDTMSWSNVYDHRHTYTSFKVDQE